MICIRPENAYYPLVPALENIWDRQIEPLYQAGKIQTERHLQAYLFMWLKSSLDETDWNIWVEPHFYFEDSELKHGKMYKPDIVVTHGNELAGIFELKFSPQQHNPEANLLAAERDIDKLSIYFLRASTFPEYDETGGDPKKKKPNRDIFLLELDPAEGSYRHEPIYRRTDETIFGFLGIARYGSREDVQRLEKYTDEDRLPKGRTILKLFCAGTH
jgi:hypothetical protein